MLKQKKETGTYWFPAKKYGWGWGFPRAWQGWVTLIVYMGLITFSIFFFPPRENLTLFISLAVVLSLILIGVCRIKGEPPRWRWGDDKKKE